MFSDNDSAPSRYFLEKFLSNAWNWERGVNEVKVLEF